MLWLRKIVKNLMVKILIIERIIHRRASRATFLTVKDNGNIIILFIIFMSNHRRTTNRTHAAMEIHGDSSLRFR